MLEVLLAVNSFVGRSGNVGQRAGFIIDLIAQGPHRSITVARGGDEVRSETLISMGPIGQVPRLLNAIRIYLAGQFPARRIDRRLFEAFLLLNWPRLPRLANSSTTRVFHCWDYLPRALFRAKSEGFKTVLDVPIAPSIFLRELGQKGLLVHSESEISREIERERRCFELADVILVPSEFVATLVKDYGISGARVEVIQFGAPERIQARTEFKSSLSSGIDYVFAGAINQRKGIDLLVEAFDDPVFAADRLHLCGRLFKNQKRKILAASKARIILPGFVDTMDYFRKCDVYVFPSLMEGSSKSVFEAMAAGLPVIATPNAGTVVRDGIEGLLIEAGSVDAIRTAMNYFKLNPTQIRKMGLNGIDRALEYPWSLYARRVIELYESLS